MLNKLMTKIKNRLVLQTNQTQMDQAIVRVNNAQQLVLLRTDYLE